MGCNCAPLVADLLLILFCERFHVVSLLILSIFRYLDDFLNFDNPYFEQNGRPDISHGTSVK